MGNDYGYTNARLRALKSRLLTFADYTALLETATLEEMIAKLAESAYGPEIQAARVKSAGWECLAEGVRRHMTGTLVKISRSFKDEPLVLWQILIDRWQVFSLKTVLRGLAHLIPANEVLESLVPIGELKESDYGRLAQATTVRESVDLLATWRHPYASALAEAMPRYAEHSDLGVIDAALDRARYRMAFRQLQRLDDEGAETVRGVLSDEIDSANILTLLRLSASSERVHLTQANAGLSPAAYLIGGPGPVTERLLSLREIPEVTALARDLANTEFGEAMARGMAAYHANKSLQAFEDELDERSTRRSVAFFRHDPLSIGIGVAYLAALVNEVRNLRVIGRGKAAGWTHEQMKKEMRLWQN